MVQLANKMLQIYDFNSYLKTHKAMCIEGLY